MAIDDFDAMGVALLPNETNAPLPVDAKAPPALAVARQELQAIAGRNAQGFHPLCRVNQTKLAPGGAYCGLGAKVISKRRAPADGFSICMRKPVVSLGAS